MAIEHLLNLDILAQEDVGAYALLRFEGREAISETFDYHLELIAATRPDDLGGWIGQLAEWTVALVDGVARTFAGRIYETRFSTGGTLSGGDPDYRIHLRVRPAFHATAYARATHVIQDMDASAIFTAMTADVPGLVPDKAIKTPPKRGYATRYDETEYDFLARLLAQDGIFYYFTYDRGAGPFHHKMHLGDSASAYGDVPGGDEGTFRPGADSSTLKSLAHARRAWPGASDFHAFDVNKLDTPWTANAPGASAWGKVYAHSYEHLSGEAAAQADTSARATQYNDAYGQEAETIGGDSDNPEFFAGGRIQIDWEGAGSGGQRVVLTSVTHSAYDPWMLGDAGAAQYRNDFTAMDAATAFRPPVPLTRRRAPGPVLGLVSTEAGAEGEAKIDDQSRIPVAIVSGRDYKGALPKMVWLPVQQQWAAGTHGAQFFPRIGSRVVIDFLYGDPDLPFVSGTMYNPAQKYPFDPAGKATQTGWRSVTDKNGSIVQEFLFEDKPGAEEIQLTTDRDYRRMVKNDDWGTIKHDQTLIVENDQTETVKHDAKLNVENDRTVKITGVQDTTIQKTRTVTVTQKSLLESKQEIELKVGPCSIKMTLDKIVITAPQIEIKGTATVKVEAGAMLETKATLTQQNADAMMIIKGGLVMIN